MKALTICQPYAELIARGDKPIENRTWPTHYRGPLLIHAGKSRAWLGDDDEEAALYGVNVAEISFGAIIARANLVGCFAVDDPAAWPYAFSHLRAHEHAYGPWCWILTNVERIDPLPYRGAMGVFDVPDSIMGAVEALPSSNMRTCLLTHQPHTCQELWPFRERAWCAGCEARPFPSSTKENL